jgi:hypothetical protein
VLHCDVSDMADYFNTSKQMQYQLRVPAHPPFLIHPPILDASRQIKYPSEESQ